MRSFTLAGVRCFTAEVAEKRREVRGEKRVEDEIFLVFSADISQRTQRSKALTAKIAENGR